jgi:hypothetical protein
MGDRIRVKGGVLLGALVSGALAAGTLTGAPTANATCASFWGIGNSAECTSTLFNAAIAIGTGATAKADGGFFDVAFSIGPDSAATTKGNLSTAVAVGATGGLHSTVAFAGFDSSSFANIAVSLGNDSGAYANYLTPGFGNLAFNLGQGNNVEAEGYLSSAISVGGNQPYTNNDVRTSGVLNSAFTLGGNKNTVTAGPGPFAIAGSILQTGATIKKLGPGFNINGVSFGSPSAAANRIPKTSAPTATAVRTGKGTASAASSVGGSKRTAAPSAASVGHKK